MILKISIGMCVYNISFFGKKRFYHSWCKNIVCFSRYCESTVPRNWNAPNLRGHFFLNERCFRIKICSNNFNFVSLSKQTFRICFHDRFSPTGCRRIANTSLNNIHYITDTRRLLSPRPYRIQCLKLAMSAGLWQVILRN